MANSALFLIARERTVTALSDETMQQRRRVGRRRFEKGIISIKVLAFWSCANFICFTSFLCGVQLSREAMYYPFN